MQEDSEHGCATSMILFVIIIIGSVFIKWLLADHDPKPAKVKKGV